MPKPTPKKVANAKKLTVEDFIEGAVATNAEKGKGGKKWSKAPAKESSIITKKVTNKKEPNIFVGVRLPESIVDMLDEYDANYAMRGESKNSIMVEGIKREIIRRLKKSKG